MVWENVPGSFSSNEGKDFQAVLTEIVRIIEPTAPDVPMPDKGWPYAGCIYGEMGNWSIAYRVHDAQYEGKPPTLGSLFDGIGGFPLSWAEVNGPDSVIWASEIEEFPIAVTKKHFGDDDAGIVGDIRKYL